MAARPLIVEIKRHSLEDGPGIRSVVFFKGCPLRCAFCHSPETQLPGPEVAFYPDRCVGSGACANACTREAITLGRTERIDRSRCQPCEACSAACPSGGLRLVGRYVPVEELVATLLRDRPFYRHSGGGVTLSGGECTLYPDYVEDLPRATRTRGRAGGDRDLRPHRLRPSPAPDSAARAPRLLRPQVRRPRGTDAAGSPRWLDRCTTSGSRLHRGVSQMQDEISGAVAEAGDVNGAVDTPLPGWARSLPCLAGADAAEDLARLIAAESRTIGFGPGADEGIRRGARRLPRQRRPSVPQAPAPVRTGDDARRARRPSLRRDARDPRRRGRRRRRGHRQPARAAVGPDPWPGLPVGGQELPRDGCGRGREGARRSAAGRRVFEPGHQPLPRHRRRAAQRRHDRLVDAALATPGGR